jgi:hypothetical protein
MPWEEVGTSLLEPEDRETFGHRKDAIDRYLAGASLKDIKTATKVGGNFLRKMIGRCLLIAADGQPYGYRALIPNFAVKKYVRTVSLSGPGGISGSGFAGSLTAVFGRHQGLQDKLNTFILKTKKIQKGLDSEDKFAHRPKDVHLVFLDLLKAAGHPTDEWPFTSKYRGGRSVSEYVTKLRRENFDTTVRLTGNKAAVAHLSVGGGQSRTIKWRGFNDGWQIDSHTIDAAFVIGIPNSAGLISYKELKRLHMLVAIESYLGSVMWFRIVYGDDVTSEDVVALIRDALSTRLPMPRMHIPNLVMKEGAGYPADIFPEVSQAIPSVIQMDNALAQLATKVSSELRKQIGCALEYGPPGHFERRPDIENLFKQFTQELSQRLRSSTGTGPDGGGDKNPGKTAVAFRIESQALEHLAYVTLANLNGEPNEGLGYLSPISAVSQFLAKGEQHFLPRKLPADRRDVVGSGLVRVKRVVKGSFESGQKPFVNFERVRYTSSHFQEATSLYGQEIVLEINESDITVIYAFLITGESLGPLTAQGAWADIPHSRKTRKNINSLKYLKVISFIEGQSPVSVYNDYLKGLALNENPREKKARKTASEIDRMRHETNGGEVNTPSNEETLPPPVSSPALPPTREWVLPSNVLDIQSLLKKLRG